MSGWALILDSPVIIAIASGQGLLKPSFITSLKTAIERLERRSEKTRITNKDVSDKQLNCQC